MTRKALIFALSVLLAITAMPVFGQETAPTGRFEWARSIHTGTIRCSATDSEGNLYIIAEAVGNSQYTVDDNVSGQPLKPAEISGQGGIGMSVIAKINPTGGLVWKKVITYDNNGYVESANLRLLGDTALACMSTFTLAYQDNYSTYCLYYLDTMICDSEGNPVEFGDFATRPVTAYMVFDLDGNLQENHFLWLSYADSLGNDISLSNTANAWRDNLLGYTFDVAPDGTIYIMHHPKNHVANYTAEDGSIHSTRMWVDNRIVGTMPAHPIIGQPQLLKFAPHFDTLLEQRYMIQSYNIDTLYQYPTVVDFSECSGPIHVGPDGCVYWPASFDARGIHSVTFDQRPGYTIQTEMWPNGPSFRRGLLFKFGKALDLHYIFYLDDVVMSTSYLRYNASCFYDVAFDADSGLIFIHGSAVHRSYLDTTSNYTCFAYDGDTLADLDGACILVLREEGNHPVLHSYGKLPATKSDHVGDVWASWTNDKIAVGRNRIFAQAKYSNKLYLPNQTVQLPRFASWYAGLCLAVYDYAGHCLYGIDYGYTHPDGGPAGAQLRDSVLYLINDLYGEAHFGTHGGNYDDHNATIVRYVDTAFMSTYIYTEDTGDVRITLVEDGTALVAYPNPFRQSVRIKVQGGQLKEHNGTVTAILTDLTGRHEQVRLSPDAPGQYTLDLTSRPQATYMLTLTTAGGKQHTMRLLKQSDIFGQ